MEDEDERRRKQEQQWREEERWLGTRVKEEDDDSIETEVKREPRRRKMRDQRSLRRINETDTLPKQTSLESSCR